MKNLKISLIIPAHNEEKYIADCLGYVQKNGNDFFEIIVVDNCSNDATSEIAKKFSFVRVVYEEKKGLTRARQRGFIEAKGDILAYVDADTRIPSGWFQKIVEEFQDDKLGALSGPYEYYDLSNFQSFLVKMYWYILALPVYHVVGYMVVGGNFAIRKSVLEKMNGFDTSIEFYGEDTNIARRASKFGKVKFRPDFQMYTSARRLSQQGSLKTSLIYVSNFLSEVFRHKPSTKEYKDIR